MKRNRSSGSYAWTQFAKHPCGRFDKLRVRLLAEVSILREKHIEGMKNGRVLLCT